jgi:hypothetical protein
VYRGELSALALRLLGQLKILSYFFPLRCSLYKWRVQRARSQTRETRPEKPVPKAKILLTFFVFEASVSVEVSLSPNALNASPAWPDDCYATGPSHHVSHLWSHHGLCASVQTARRCRPKGTHFGHGQNTVLGWSDPHFSGARAAKSLGGRFSPTRLRSRKTEWKR